MRRWIAGAVVLSLAPPAWAARPGAGSDRRAGGSIDMETLERPWPKQWEHRYEVGRDEVAWRQRASAKDGIFAGIKFTAPADLETVWKLSADYTELKSLSPDITRMCVIKQTEVSDVVELDMKVLWKNMTLRFEIERDWPRGLRFRLTNPSIGDYRGICRMEAVPTAEGKPPRTSVEFITWLQPAVRVPPRLVLWAERTVMLNGVRKFIKACRTPPDAGT